MRCIKQINLPNIANVFVIANDKCKWGFTFLIGDVAWITAWLMLHKIKVIAAVFNNGVCSPLTF